MVDVRPLEIAAFYARILLLVLQINPLFTIKKDWQILRAEVDYLVRQLEQIISGSAD